MRIARIRLALPPRMKRHAVSEARLIAATIAETLATHGDGRGPLRIEIGGHGRPARHLAHDLSLAAGHAARAARREG